MQALLALMEIAQSASEAVPKRKHPERVLVPNLPTRGKLTTNDRWASLIWSIDTAQQHGKWALKGLALALARVIQGQALEKLLLDARMKSGARMGVDDLLWDDAIELNAGGQTLKSLPRRYKRTKSVDMAEVAVFPCPWEPFRLMRALEKLGEDRQWGPWRQDPNHFGVEWRPWPILWVNNGNHSTMAAVIRDGGKFKPYESYDLSPVLKAVRTDGSSWMRADTGEVFASASSMEMAGIFVIGQRLIRLAGQ